jgi:diguanylate cyclase (GGDEF)-like protein/PAS domain S-box-containing protein
MVHAAQHCVVAAPGVAVTSPQSSPRTDDLLRVVPSGTPHARERYRSLSDPESLRHFAHHLREAIYITSVDGRILDGNPAFLAMVGATSIEDLASRHAADLLAEPAERQRQLDRIRRDGAVRDYELVIRTLGGELRTVVDSCYLVRDPDTGEEFCHGMLMDITARKLLEAQLTAMSTHDSLTGALNRHCLAGIEAEFALAPDEPWGCLFVDIDAFKQYNDQFGHRQGDLVLVRLVRFLMRHVRAEEPVIRMGGDEFVVLLRGAGAESTRGVADRLREAADTTAPVPFSLGCATRRPGESLQELVDRADRGLITVRTGSRGHDQPSARATG